MGKIGAVEWGQLRFVSVLLRKLGFGVEVWQRREVVVRMVAVFVCCNQCWLRKWVVGVVCLQLGLGDCL